MTSVYQSDYPSEPKTRTARVNQFAPGFLRPTAIVFSRILICSTVGKVVEGFPPDWWLPCASDDEVLIRRIRRTHRTPNPG